MPPSCRARAGAQGRVSDVRRLQCIAHLGTVVQQGGAVPVAQVRVRARGKQHADLRAPIRGWAGPPRLLQRPPRQAGMQPAPRLRLPLVVDRQRERGVELLVARVEHARLRRVRQQGGAAVRLLPHRGKVQRSVEPLVVCRGVRARIKKRLRRGRGRALVRRRAPPRTARLQGGQGGRPRNERYGRGQAAP